MLSNPYLQWIEISILTCKKIDITLRYVDCVRDNGEVRHDDLCRSPLYPPLTKKHHTSYEIKLELKEPDVVLSMLLVDGNIDINMSKIRYYATICI